MLEPPSMQPDNVTVSPDKFLTPNGFLSTKPRMMGCALLLQISDCSSEPTSHRRSAPLADTFRVPATDSFCLSGSHHWPVHSKGCIVACPFPGYCLLPALSSKPAVSAHQLRFPTAHAEATPWNQLHS